MDKLKEAIIYFSDLIEKIFEETFNQADFGDLTPQQFKYLNVIVKLKNPTLTELARELGLTKPTVTVLADKLTEKGYIKRINSDKDRRVIHLQINDKGEKIRALRETAHEHLAERIKSGLSENEITILTRLFRKIVKHP